MQYHLENAVAHILYDISLPFPERKEQARVFKSAMAVANYLGYPPHQIFPYRQPGKRIKCRKTGKEYAVRIFKREVING